MVVCKKLFNQRKKKNFYLCWSAGCDKLFCSAMMSVKLIIFAAKKHFSEDCFTRESFVFTGDIIIFHGLFLSRFIFCGESVTKQSTYSDSKKKKNPLSRSEDFKKLKY